MKKILNRNEVPVNETWDLSHIYKDTEAFDSAVRELKENTKNFVKEFKSKIKSASDVNKALDKFADLVIAIDHISHYAYLAVEADTTDKEAAQREAATTSMLARIFSDLAFLDTELAALDNEILKEARDSSKENARYIEKLIKKKTHLLSEETEAALAALTPTMQAPYQFYNDIKFGDISFPNFELDGEEYEMTYNAFENRYETDSNTELRRKAAQVFYDELARHKNATASAYNAQVQMEKIEANLRGYETVFDFLLDRQEVSRDMYDRQIDVITKELAPAMRKYAGLIKKVHGLDKMTSYDLKLELDPDYVSNVSFEEADEYIKDGLKILGPDYVEMLDQAFKNRWIDYAENRGKRTGAFCAGPYNIHPYILTSFNSKMDEVATLAHELGHAGADIFSSKALSILNTDMSMYIVESPSTTNELIMENYLLKKAEGDKRQERWVLSQMISKTYYHNFVTHLLEAAYQREVYRIVEAGGSLDADKLSEIYKKVLENFWGDEVDIEEGSYLTWMRQPHYYMGLYSYTYSAGLTVGTQMALKLIDDPSVAGKWRQFLASGGSMPPVEQAALVGVDIRTDKPLRDTIAYISSLIDRMAELTEEIEG